MTVPINLHRAKPRRPLRSRASVIRTRLLFLVAFFALAAIPLSAGTKIVRRWGHRRTHAQD